MITPPRCRKIFGLAVGVALTLSGNAQTPPPINDVAHVSVELDSGWTLESAIVNNELVGFFAWIPQAEVTPGNVYLAWLEHVGDGAWIMYGWADGSAANAVSAIESAVNDAGALDGVDLNQIDNDPLFLDPCDPGIQPGGQGGTAMPAGVTVNDPAAPIVNAVAGDPSTAVPLLDALSLSGASAAPGLSQSIVSQSLCPGISDLDASLNRVMHEIMTSIPFTYDGGATMAALASCGGLCIPSTRTWTTSLAPVCTPGGTFIVGASGLTACRYTCTQREFYWVRTVDIWCNVGISFTTAVVGVTVNIPWGLCDGPCPALPQ
ncbi:MAG: hypothetical protein AAFR76_07665 [Planctomycetota bacterium]